MLDIMAILACWILYLYGMLDSMPIMECWILCLFRHVGYYVYFGILDIMLILRLQSEGFFCQAPGPDCVKVFNSWC